MDLNHLALYFSSIQNDMI